MSHLGPDELARRYPEGFHGRAKRAEESAALAKKTLEFRREPRYIVFKVKDAISHLSVCELDRLREIGEKIAAGRATERKPPFNALVVEQDWPEFEWAWAAIEARMNVNALTTAITAQKGSK